MKGPLPAEAPLPSKALAKELIGSRRRGLGRDGSADTLQLSRAHAAPMAPSDREEESARVALLLLCATKKLASSTRSGLRGTARSGSKIGGRENTWNGTQGAVWGLRGAGEGLQG